VVDVDEAGGGGAEIGMVYEFVGRRAAQSRGSRTRLGRLSASSDLIK
jgi:hypothetical protein